LTTLQILLYMSLMLTRYQKFMASFALLLLFLFNHPASAESVFSQLKTLEQAVNITLNRLESDIQLDPATGPATVDFAQRAGQQLQMTLVALGRESLLQEDYYHLCLYLLARKNRDYAAAIAPLEYEVNMAQIPQLRRWLQRRLSLMHEMASGKVPEEPGFSIADEFNDLRRLLRRR